MVPNYFCGRPQRAKDSSKIDVWGPNEHNLSSVFLWTLKLTNGQGQTRMVGRSALAHRLQFGQWRHQNFFWRGEGHRGGKVCLFVCLFCLFLLYTGSIFRGKFKYPSVLPYGPVRIWGGKNPKHCRKWLIFVIFCFWLEGASGGRASNRGKQMPSMPPLGAATEFGTPSS